MAFWLKIILTCEKRFLTTLQQATDMYAVLRYSALAADSGVCTCLHNHVTGYDVISGSALIQIIFNINRSAMLPTTFYAV